MVLKYRSSTSTSTQYYNLVPLPPLAAPLCVTVCAFARTVTIDTHLSHTEERATFRVTVDGRVANCVRGERFASTVSATVISIEYLVVFIEQHVTNVHANHDLKAVAYSNGRKGKINTRTCIKNTNWQSGKHTKAIKIYLDRKKRLRDPQARPSISPIVSIQYRLVTARRTDRRTVRHITTADTPYVCLLQVSAVEPIKTAPKSRV